MSVNGFMLKENGLTCLHDHTHCRLINHNWVKNIHVNMLTCCMHTDRSSQEQESKKMKTLHCAVISHTVIVVGFGTVWLLQVRFRGQSHLHPVIYPFIQMGTLTHSSMWKSNAWDIKRLTFLSVSCLVIHDGEIGSSSNLYYTESSRWSPSVKI